MDKIMPFESFVSSRKSIKGKLVLAGGCFDVFHYGHLIYLQKAKEQGDILVVLLEPDEAIIAKKNQAPIHSQQERAEILAANKDVDCVILLGLMRSDEEYAKVVEQIKPEIIAVTEGDEQIKNKQDQARKVGANVVAVTPLIKKLSSSKIKSHASVSSN